MCINKKIILNNNICISKASKEVVISCVCFFIHIVCTTIMYCILLLYNMAITS